MGDDRSNRITEVKTIHVSSRTSFLIDVLAHLFEVKASSSRVLLE